MDTRTCFGCKRPLPATTEFFYRDKCDSIGLQRECRLCTTWRKHKYNQSEQSREVRRIYERSPGARKARKKWRDNNPDWVRRYAREYVQRRRGQGTSGYFLSILSAMRSRARKLAIEMSIGRQDLCDLYEQQAGRCAITGNIMTLIVGQGIVQTNCSVDRVNPKQGYTKNNIQLVCLWVNTMKGAMSMPEFVHTCSCIAVRNVAILPSGAVE